MINAEMKNKVPKLENKEDILTSNVFGLFELIEYKYLLDILKNASNEANHNLIEKFKDRKIKSFELWKRFENSEPDIYVSLDNGISFVIEIKYYGGEHNKKEIDEEDGKYVEKGQLKKYLEVTHTNFIIYLTASYLSLKELSKDSKECLNQIHHMHWKDFNKYAKEILSVHQMESCEKNILRKLTEYLDYKGFDSWNGFRSGYENIDTNNIGGFYEK